MLQSKNNLVTEVIGDSLKKIVNFTFLGKSILFSVKKLALVVGLKMCTISYLKAPFIR